MVGVIILIVAIIIIVKKRKRNTNEYEYEYEYEDVELKESIESLFKIGENIKTDDDIQNENIVEKTKKDEQSYGLGKSKTKKKGRRYL